MFARVATSATTLALGACAVSVPGGPAPRQVERIAPIETAGPAFDAACEENDDWNKPAPPVRIHGNTYLVGTCGISAILVTGSDGHVLVDSGTEKGAEVVLANIRRLGFNPHDVKLLLHSHEHIDHVGGMARLQQVSGAQLVASPVAAQVFGTGSATSDDPQAGMHPPFPVVPVSRVIADGEQVRLGDLVLTAIATPGHTAGALSWTWGSCEAGVCRRIVYADSLSPFSRDDYRFSDHPEYVAAYRAGLARVSGIDCDILLTPHPSASNMIERMAGRAPLVNAAGCSDYAASISRRLDERLAKEQAGR